MATSMATAAVGSVAPPSGEVDLSLTLRNLLAELVEVRDWRTLGVQLAVPKLELSKINARFDGEGGRCKKKVLDWWLTNDRQRSWEKLAQALEKMGQHKELVERLWRQYVTPPPTEPHAHLRMRWEKFADMPVKVKVPHAVVVGGKKIFVASQGEELSQIFQYHSDRREWSTVPASPRDAWSYSLGQLSGELLMVGGYTNMQGVPMVGNYVFSFNAELQKWEELSPMPTARASACVANTSSALIVAGGYILNVEQIDRLGDSGSLEGVDSDTEDDGSEASVFSTAVEVYSAETAQWSVADALPSPCYRTSAIIISNTCYLMGMVFEERPTGTVLHAPVSSLLRKAVPITQRSANALPPGSGTSVWKRLGINPFGVIGFAAANLGGILLAHGGADQYRDADAASDDDDDDDFSTVLLHAYSPAKECWTRVQSSGDLPAIEMDVLSFALASFGAVELPGHGLLVIGYVGDKAVMYLGSVV